MALSTILTVVHGEQIRVHFNVGWIADLSGYTITARIVEGLNDGLGTVPTAEDLESLVTTSLPVINISGSEFDVVFPASMLTGWTFLPKPDKPSYGYFDISIADTGIAEYQQIFKPVQGLVQIMYSPLETA